MLGHQCTLTRGDDDAADGNCGGDGDDDDRESLLCAIFKRGCSAYDDSESVDAFPASQDLRRQLSRVPHDVACLAGAVDGSRQNMSVLSCLTQFLSTSCHVRRSDSSTSPASAEAQKRLPLQDLIGSRVAFRHSVCGAG